MASIAAWKIRVPFPFKWGADEVDAVLVVRRANVEEREDFKQVARESDKHYRSMQSLVGAAKISPSKQQRIEAEAERLTARLRAQAEEFIIGVEGVEVETAPGESAPVTDAAGLLEAFGSSPQWIGAVWRTVAEAQHLSPELGNSSGATPAS